MMVIINYSQNETRNSDSFQISSGQPATTFAIEGPDATATYSTLDQKSHLLPSRVSRMRVLSRYMNFAQSIPSSAHSFSTDLNTSCQEQERMRMVYKQAEMVSHL